jgi:hypothetical protein
LAQHRYTASNLTRRNIEWEERVLEKPAPGLIITHHAAICWLADCRPAIGFDRRARARSGPALASRAPHVWRRAGDAAACHRQQCGRLERRSGRSCAQTWQMEEIAIRRVGLGLTRISRLLSIDPPPASTP